jgi:hypothetical protein
MAVKPGSDIGNKHQNSECLFQNNNQNVEMRNGFRKSYDIVIEMLLASQGVMLSHIYN